MKKVTFTLAPEDAASMRVIKHLQALVHKSDEWKRWYGMRSHVDERTSTESRCHSRPRPRPALTEQQDASSPERSYS